MEYLAGRSDGRLNRNPLDAARLYQMRLLGYDFVEVNFYRGSSDIMILAFSRQLLPTLHDPVACRLPLIQPHRRWSHLIYIIDARRPSIVLQSLHVII